MCKYIEIKLFLISIYMCHYFQLSWRKLMVGCTTNNFHDVDNICHDLQTIGSSYFPKNKPPKVVINE